MVNFFTENAVPCRNDDRNVAVRFRLAVEAAAPQPWYRWIGEHGLIMGLERFGASAPYQRIYQEFGLTVENVVRRAKELLGEM